MNKCWQMVKANIYCYLLFLWLTKHAMFFFIFLETCGISRIFVIWLLISIISVFLSSLTIHFVFCLKLEPGELIVTSDCVRQ